MLDKEVQVGDFLPDITKGVDRVYVHCSISDNMHSAIGREIVYPFSLSDLEVREPFFRRETNGVFRWCGLTTKIIERIRIQLKDKEGRPVRPLSATSVLLLTRKDV